MLNRAKVRHPPTPVWAPIPRLTTILVLIVCYVGSNMPTALYSVFRAELGFSATVQTLIFTAYVVGMVPALVLTGRLVHKHGPRTLMAGGLIISLVAALALAGPASVIVLLIARFLQGVSLGLVMVAGTAALHAAVPARPRASAALWIALTGAIGCTIGPPLGGSIADTLDRSTTAPFLIAAGLLFLCLVMLGVRGGSRAGTPAILPDDAPTSGSAATPSAEPARSILLIGLTAGLSWACIGVYQAIGPTLIGTALGWRSLGALGLVVAVVLAAAGTTQVFTRNMPVALSRHLGLAFIVLGALSFVAMLVTGSLVLALVAALAAGIGQGFAYLSSTKELGDASQQHAPSRRGKIVGLYFMAAYLGMSVPALALGLLTDLCGLVPAGSAIMALIIAGCVAMACSNAREKQPTTASNAEGFVPSANAGSLSVTVEK